MVAFAGDRCSKMRNARWTVFVYVAIFISVCFLLSSYHSGCVDDAHAKAQPSSVQRSGRQWIVEGSNGKRFTYDSNSPLIFIGGVPRSGTTLMRAMMDAHPDVRCGEETRVVPRILGMRAQWKRSEKESKRLLEAGISDDIIDSALSNFMLEFIVRHGPPATRLCNKDPFTLKSGEYLAELYPNAKFVLMIRDGRAVVHSIITRKVTITGFDLSSYRQCLEKWNQAITTMYHQCYLLGESRCFPMYYEELVLHPREVMTTLLKWLELPWNETVLHHEQFVGKKISLSKTEKSTDQVVKPVNLEALSKWVGAIPNDVVKDMATIAPMLNHLGYDPRANPPKYGSPDSSVIKNTEDIKKNFAHWDKVAHEVVSPSNSKNRDKSGEGNLDFGAAPAVQPTGAGHAADFS